MKSHARFRGCPPQPFIKFHDGSLNICVVICKRDFKLTIGNFLVTPTPDADHRGKQTWLTELGRVTSGQVSRNYCDCTPFGAIPSVVPYGTVRYISFTISSNISIFHGFMKECRSTLAHSMRLPK